MGMQISLRRFDRLMTEPQRDDGAIDTRLQQLHRSAVPQHVRRHSCFFLARRALVALRQFAMPAGFYWCAEFYAGQFESWLRRARCHADGERPDGTADTRFESK